MSLWSITQTSDFSWKPQQTGGIRTVDDTAEDLRVALLALFGDSERANVAVTQPGADEIVATIKYSPSVKAGFVRDREVPGDYTVTFRAVRVG